MKKNLLLTLFILLGSLAAEAQFPGGGGRPQGDGNGRPRTETPQSAAFEIPQNKGNSKV